MKEDKDIKFELLKLEFEKSLELRNIELDNFWKRGWFFGALLIALIAGYFQLDAKDTKVYCVFIAFLGLLVSIFQSLMNRGSKYWQERWEYKTRNRESALGINLIKTSRFKAEKYLFDACTLAKDENPFTVARRFSVTKLTILVWDVIAIFWLVLWLKDLQLFPVLTSAYAIFIFHGIIILYILLFFFFKSKPLDPNRKWFPYFKKGGGKVYFGFIKKDRTKYDQHSEFYFENNEDELGKLDLE